MNNRLFFYKFRLFVVVILLLGMVVACSSGYVDGEYRAEFAAYDSLGFKEFLVARVENGKVTMLRIDGQDANGITKTNNKNYRIAMELATGTYPDKVFETLDGRYLLIAQQKKSKQTVDAVAGATLTSNNYAVLFKALQKAFVSGDTTTVIVENLSEHTDFEEKNNDE